MAEEHYDGVDYCVICGAPVPEGRQVCALCEQQILTGNISAR